MTTFLNRSIPGGSVTVYDTLGKATSVELRWAKVSNATAGPPASPEQNASRSCIDRRRASLGQRTALRSGRICPDGEVACIDFEDDPAAVLPLAVCHVRDALCYAHSTAIFLHTSGTLTEGRARWAAWVAQGSAEMREVLATSVRRMGWMRHLPTNRKLGRDLQRVRAAYDLLA